jgi:ribosomal protein S27AE
MKKRKRKCKTPINNKGTLDLKHSETIAKFENLKKSLPEKKIQLKEYEDELSILKSMNPNKYSHKDIRQKAFLMDAIKDLKKEIASIENNEESLNYISKTLPVLINYYDSKDIVDCVKKEIDPELFSGKNNIFTYLFKDFSDSEKENKPVEKIINRASLYDDYLDRINSNKISRDNINKCSIPECGGERIISHQDGFMVCKKCGLTEVVMLTNDKKSSGDTIKDSGAIYKRMNHLTEILSQLQAKESTDIPRKVFESIYQELRIRKKNKNSLNIFSLRKILKKLGYQDYYEHVSHILQVINGKEPPKLTREMENKIKQLFREIQEPFELFRPKFPKRRRNFLNYYYVLHKICELLSLDEYVNYFPLLKNNEKLLEHDKIWKKICEYLKWEFYKSI